MDVYEMSALRAYAFRVGTAAALAFALAVLWLVHAVRLSRWAGRP
jgi:hypothetical protein